MMKVRFLRTAAEEIENNRAWYRERSLLAEAAYLSDFDQALKEVIEGPDRWPLHIRGTRRHVFARFPFSIIYVVRDDVLNIIAVPHDRQKPGYWLKRLRT